MPNQAYKFDTIESLEWGEMSVRNYESGAEELKVYAYINAEGNLSFRVWYKGEMIVASDSGHMPGGEELSKTLIEGIRQAKEGRKGS